MSEVSTTAAITTTITVAILAGGQSRRMGTDKSFTLLRGKPVFEHVLSRIRELDLPTTLVTNSPEKYAHYQLPMCQDMLPDQGALGGVYTAIASSPSEWVLCVACDMPFLNVALLRHLFTFCTPEWDIVTPRINGYPETMHTVYRKTCINPITTQLEGGNLRASGFYDKVRVRYVEEVEARQFDPELRSFVNLNTLDDLAAAQTQD